MEPEAPAAGAGDGADAGADGSPTAGGAADEAVQAADAAAVVAPDAPGAGDPAADAQAGEDREAAIETLKAATKDLIAKKGVEKAQDIFKGLGIAQPGKTPPEKIPGALAAVRKALAAV